jgi:hypothetical protein
MHSTSGSVSKRRGRLLPQPPVGTELSTGTPRGSDPDDGCAPPTVAIAERGADVGVAVPGVGGGVKAGESNEGGGGGCVG